MPNIDHFLYTEVPVTKPTLLKASESLEAPHLELHRDSRTWNKDRLAAMELLLVNAVWHQHKDGGLFFYSRKHQSIHHQFNPVGVNHGSLISCIDALASADLIKHTKGRQRKKDVKLTKGEDGKLYHETSEFQITPKILKLCSNLGLTKEAIQEHKRFHVRLRPENRPDLVPYEHDDYSAHIETLMAGYCHRLNQHRISVPSNDSTEDNLIYFEYGRDAEAIHLFRNYREYTKRNEDEIANTFPFIEQGNWNFAFGGRSGGYWIGTKRELRPYIKINGRPTDKADFPCSHINICYKHETGQWLQQKTYRQLKAEGRETEDAYYIENVERDIVKRMVTIMFNVKTRASASGSFNKWIGQRNDDERENATTEEIQLYKDSLKATGLAKDDFNKWLIKQILPKHKRIKAYFLKGKLSGQIIQWVEANLIHHLADYFTRMNNFPVLTVHDELIVPADEQPMVAEFMFNSLDLHGCEFCREYSLLNRIKYAEGDIKAIRKKKKKR